MLISDAHKTLNARKHETSTHFGTGGHTYAGIIQSLTRTFASKDVLDYGCGKHSLAQSLPFHIREYDPCIAGYDSLPSPADIVVCTDVLEHVEPEYLENVLDHLKELTRKAGFFTIHVGPAMKHLPDGRNAHLTQQPMSWWLPKLFQRFEIAQVQAGDNGMGFLVIVTRKNDA